MNAAAPRTDRSPRASRTARALALAVVPVMLAAGCSGSDAGEDATEDQQSTQTTAPPTPEPVRFETLPEPCSLLSEDTIRDAVPRAEPRAGEELSSSDTSASGACLWSGLREYQFRSLTVSLRRFESDVAIGSGDERAGEYQAQVVAEIADDDANEELSQTQLDDAGDAATSLSYRSSRRADGEREEYRQQRVVARTGNVVVTVDYTGAGFEDADTPGATPIREAAEAAAREAVAAVNAAETAPAEDDASSEAPSGQDQDDTSDG